MKPNRHICLLVAAAVASLPGASTFAATPATYIGLNNGAYNAGSNWDVGVAPNNGSGITYDVIIDNSPSPITVLLNMSPTIDTLTINAGDALSMNNSQDLTIAGGSIVNNGLLNLNTAGSNTELKFSTNAAITGSGSITLTNSLANRLTGTSGVSLTIANTLVGAGQIGLNNLLITNNAILIASSSNGLALDPLDSGTSFTNNGTLRADGGPLSLSAGTYTGGILDARNGSLLHISARALVQSALFTSDTTAAAIRVDGGAIANATNSAYIALANNFDGLFQGVLNNLKIIAVLSAGSTTDFKLNGDLTLAGGGTLALSNSTANRINATATTFTFTTNNLITGSGQVGCNVLTIVNTGTITASASTGLYLDPIDTPSGFTNNGTLSADGGTLYLNPGTYTGGVLNARHDSAIQVTGGALVQSALLTSDTTSAAILLVNGALANATSSACIAIPSSFSGFVRGTLNNLNIIALNSAGSLTDLTLTDNLTLAGSGTITLTNSTANRINATATTFTFTTNNLITGSGQIGLNALTIVNAGTITASATTGLYLDPVNTPAGFINNGILRADGGTLFLQDGNYNNANGTITARNSSLVQVNAGATVTGGFLTSDTTSAAISLVNGALANLSSSATIQVPNNCAGYFSGTINNTGTIALLSGGSDTILYLPADLNLTGSGTIALSNNGNNRIFGAASTRLISSNTITGAGQLGANAIAITNTALIVASSSNALTIDPVDGPGGFLNLGTLRADGGALVLAQGSYANAAHLIESRNGSPVYVNPGAVISGGTLSTDANPSSAISLNACTLDSLTIAGVVLLPNNQGAYLKGAIVNAGTLKLLSAGSTTDLVLSGDVSLSGSGSLSLSNNGNNRIYGNSGDRLSTSILISGSGQLGVDTLFVTNSGTITASASNALVLDPKPGVNGFINTGRLQADGGALYLNPGQFVNTGAVIEAKNGSSVIVVSGALVTGGTLQTDTDPNSVIVLSGGTLASLASTGVVQINNNFGGSLQGTIVNTGIIRMLSAGSSTDLVAAGDLTLSGPGTLSLSNNFNNRFYASPAARISLLSTTLTGSGQLGLDQTTFTNAGLIIASSTNALAIDPAPGPDGFINNGTLRADGGPLYLSPGSYNNASGVIEALNTSHLYITSGALVSGGTLRTSGASATVHLTGTLQNLLTTGSVQIDNNTGGTLQGAITNTGTLQLLSVGSDTVLFLNGSVSLSGAGSVSLSNNANNRIYGNPGDLLTNLDNTFFGSGQLGVNTLRINNAGALIASASNGFYIDPQDVPGSFVSTGVLRADAAPLILQTGDYALSGTVEAVNGGSITFAGGTVTLASPVNFLNSSAHFNAPSQSAQLLTGTHLSVGPGAVLTSGNVSVSASWTIDGTHALRAGGSANPRISFLPAIGSSGRLDLNDNTLIVQATSASKSSFSATLAAKIVSARNGGPWNGPGITSSTVAANPALFTVALVDNADLSLPSFAGHSLDANSLIITQALLGDADLSGIVDLGDFNRWFANVGSASYSYARGDFDQSGIIDLGDFNTWFSHVGVTWPLTPQSPERAALSTSIPEPTTLTLLTLVTPLLLKRRRLHTV